MTKNECPAPVRREIALWERNGYELLDVDVWDFPLSDEYLLTFRKKDDPCATVLVQNMEVYTYDRKVKYNGTVQMCASRLRHVAQVLEEREAEHHAAV